jgi:AAA15 family ATPase/GTPase
MLLEFNFKNFRSIKSAQNFSMEALSTKNKEGNTFEVETAAPHPYKILKSAVVYGANGSGKSNFVNALYAMRWFVVQSANIISGHDIDCYEPFELEESFDSKPIDFKITFIGKDHIKYTYEISYGRNEVFLEKLEFFPNNKAAILFERVSNNTEIHEVLLGKLLKNKRISKTVFKNQLYLSKFGTTEPHEHLTQIFKYFDDIEISRGMDRFHIDTISRRIAKFMSSPENAEFTLRLNILMQIADDNIRQILVESGEDNEAEERKESSEDQLSSFFNKNSNRTRALVRRLLYRDETEVGFVDFDMLKKESTGTNILFALGGLILQTLDKGGTFIADEFNSGLHPKLSGFLIRLFHQKSSNPNNAQIIFNTHEVALLDKDMFRSDQIWFIEKTKFGGSEMYSAQDFEGIREDIPFDKWYMAGKFDAIPKLNNTDQLRTNENS